MTLPTVLAPEFDAVPEALRQRRQWLLWRLEHKPGQKKPTKVPYRVDGQHASTTDPATWCSFEEARAAYTGGGFSGIGFAFAADDPFVGIDLDGCRDPASGELLTWARATVERFATYTEVSPSGRGVHLILVGALPPGGRKRGAIECYAEGRYFTITARSLNGVPPLPVEERQRDLDAWHAETFPPQQRKRPVPPDPGSRQAEPDDERLLARARKAKNGKKFCALYDDGDTTGYGSPSEADLGLCLILAFWTDRDPERIDRLFRRSKLYRPKWDQSAGQGETYGQRTVRTAVERSAPDRPVIVFTGLGGDVPLHQILPPAVTALAKRCREVVYARGDVLSRVVRTVEAGEDGIQRSAAPRIVRLPDSILRERLDEAACWIREKKTRQGDVVRLEEWCPRPVVEAMRDRAEWPGIRPLLGVVTAPTLRVDGSVLDRPGYDEPTGLIYMPARVYPTVPPRPSEAEVGEAYRVLLDPFREFPLATPADEAAVAALMLGIACRFAVPGPVPMTAAIAPEFGSGKTLLAHVATRAMTGHGPDEMPPVGGRRSDGEAEMRKRLTTVVMEAPRVALLDNVPDGSTLESPSLAALLTCIEWSDRILGVNRRVTLPHRVVWIATGNNIRLAGDLGRRALSVQIEPGVERPSLRTFEVGDLLDHVAHEHPRLLVAALTVVRGFHVAGRPGHGRPPLGMFTAWDGLVRAAVIWAHRLAGGEADPLDTQGRLVGEAPDREVLAMLLTAWHAELGAETTTAAEAVKRAASAPSLHDAIVGVGADHGGKADAKRLGYYLRKVAGRVVEGLVFERRGERDGAARWGIRVTGARAEDDEGRGRRGSRGSGRSPSSFVYARAGRAAARAGTDPHSSPTSPTSPGSPSDDPVEAAEREAVRDEACGLLWPRCPVCGRDDRPAGAAAGCHACGEFVAARNGRPPGAR
ncbi:MAG: hypothetical protein AB7T63_08040 [Planctomycetota bacterium]